MAIMLASDTRTVRSGAAPEGRSPPFPAVGSSDLRSRKYFSSESVMTKTTLPFGYEKRESRAEDAD